jgi:predicted ATPase
MLRTLGRLALDNQKLSRPKTLSLLAYLALEGRKPRIHVRELLWGQAADAASSLRIVIQQLRNAEVLLEESKTLACAISCDAALLLEKLDAGDDASAVELYTGVFLDGLQTDSTEFEEWVLVTRELIASRVAKAHLRLAQTTFQQSDLPTASHHAVAAYGLSKTTPLEPTDLLELLFLLEDCSHDLAVLLRQEILDLSIHIPEKNKTTTTRHLPASISGFVFRAEQAALESLLLQERLITIVGYGGAGKSRLALEVLRGLPTEFTTFFVPLEPILEPTDVPSACLRAMSYRESASEPLEQLKIQIGQKQMVLLLDNAEHLVSIGEMLEQLLESCPNLRILLTSRERLGVLGEMVFPLGGFADDESALELLEIASKRTGTNFIWHTKTAIKICALLERFPLAIELAAALVAVLPLEGILEALQEHLDALEAANGRERHRGMRAVFNWSWSLLSSNQRLGLMRLAVFRDGFSRVAALQVMQSNLTVISALVGKSLVQNQQNGRYRLHPLIAQYSLEALESIPKEAKTAKANHAEVFLAWLEQNAPLVRTAQAGTVLSAFETDLENIKVAWHWLCEHPDLARFDRLQDLGSLFDARARFEEGVQLFEKAILVLEPRMALGYGDDVAWAVALAGVKNHAAWLLYRLAKTHQALELATQAKSILEPLEPSELHLKNLNLLAAITGLIGDASRQLALHQEAADLAGKLGMVHRQAMSIHNIGRMQITRGDYASGLKNLQQAGQQYVQQGNIQGILNANLTMAHVLVFCVPSSLVESQKLLLETIQIAQEIEEISIVQWAMIYLIFAYIHHGELLNAEQMNSQFLRQFENRLSVSQPFFKIASAKLKMKKNNLPEAEVELREAIRLAENEPDLLHHALFDYADILIQKNQVEKAGHILNYLYESQFTQHWLKLKVFSLIQEKINAISLDIPEKPSHWSNYL